MKIKVAIVWAFLFMVNVSFAQNKKTLYLSKVDNICENVDLDFNISASNFSNIMGFQGAIGWDSTVLTLDSIMYGSNTGSIEFNELNTNIQPFANYFNFQWSDSVLHTVPDSTILFTIRFTVKKAFGYKIPVNFIRTATDYYTALDIKFKNLSNSVTSMANNVTFEDGYISLVDTPKIVLSGNSLICMAACIPTTYQWYLNGILLPNDTLNALTVSGNGIYTVSVSYFNGNKVISPPTSIYLPVELSNISASNTSNATILKWTSVRETSNAIYNIGRRINNEGYRTIGSVKAKGNSLGAEYAIADKELNNGTINYQLEIVEKDGSKHYSKIVVINRTIENNIKIYPNPAHQTINVEGKNICQIEVIDNNGQNISKKRFAVFAGETNSVKVMDIKKLPVGVYMVKVTSLDGTEKVEKIVVN